LLRIGGDLAMTTPVLFQRAMAAAAAAAWMGLATSALADEPAAARDPDVAPPAPPPPAPSYLPPPLSLPVLPPLTTPPIWGPVTTNPWAPGANVPYGAALHGKPVRVPWREGDPVPQGFTVHTAGVRRGPVAAGAGVFGGAYLITAVLGVLAFTVSGRDAGWLAMYVPVVGPFVAIETAKRTRTEDVELGLMVGFGTAQVLGAALLASAPFWPREKWLVQSRPTVAPFVGRESGGLSLTASF